MESLSTTDVARLVLVSPYAADHKSLRRILDSSIWRFHGFFTCNDCVEFLLNDNGVAVIVCENNLPDGHWSDLMRELDTLPSRPSFIVSARIADERLWAEVLNLGAYDLLLAAPFDPEEVVRVTESAWIAWNWRCGRSVAPRAGPVTDLGSTGLKLKAKAVC